MIGNNILKSLYILNKLNLIYDDLNLLHFDYEGEVESKFIKKVKKDIDFAFIKVKLDKNIYLLVKDIPERLFFLYTILIGENTKLFISPSNRFNDKNFYIYDKNDIIYLSDFINTNVKKSYDVKDLVGKNFNLEFKQQLILEELKKYIYEKKNINLNVIHVIKGKGLRIFSPNSSYKDLKFSKYLDIPHIKLTQNGILKDFGISIFNYREITNLINPVKILKDNYYIEKNKKNNKKIYRDLDYVIYLKIKNDILDEYFDMIKKTNFNLELLKKILYKKNKLKISLNKFDEESFFIPLFKDINKQRFVLIKDEKDFYKITGIKLDLKDKELLENIFIETESGDKAKFLSLTFKKDILNFLLKNNYEKLREYLSDFKSIRKKYVIYFKDDIDFFIKLVELKAVLDDLNLSYLKYKDKIIFVKIEELKKEEENQIFHLTNKLFNILLRNTIMLNLNSIENKNLFQSIEPKNFKELYLYDNYLFLRNLNLTFKENFSKKKLKKKLIEKLNNLIVFTRVENILSKELNYFLTLNLFEIINLIKNINETKFNKILENYKNFFPQFKILKDTFNNLLINLGEDILLYKKLVKKDINIKLVLKNSKLTEYLKTIFEDFKIIDFYNLKEFNYENKTIFYYDEIEKNFRYNYIRIKKLIEDKDYFLVNDKILFNIDQKNFFLTDKFFKNKYFFKDYKIIKENKFFFILKKI